MPLPLPLPCGIASFSILILLEVGFNRSVEFSFFYKVQSLIGEIIELISKTLIRLYVCVWQKLFLPTYFIIQLIFASIQRFHCTF